MFMSSESNRSFRGMNVIKASLLAAALAIFPIGGGATAGKASTSDMKGMPGMGGAASTTEKPSALGTVNSVDAAQRKINLSHEPIPAIKWPAMKMDFTVAPSVDLSQVKPGAKVQFTLTPGAGGTYTVESLRPVAK